MFIRSFRSGTRAADLWGLHRLAVRSRPAAVGERTSKHHKRFHAHEADIERSQLLARLLRENVVQTFRLQVCIPFEGLPVAVSGHQCHLLDLETRLEQP